MTGQSAFRAALLDPAAPPPEGLGDGSGRPTGRRFDVYRNNVVASLTEALHVAFPTVASLLGKENMDGLAGLFLRAHPPRSPLLMLYGAPFAEFVADLPQLSHLGYLPDIARLDLAMREAYHAADAAPADPAPLGALPPEALGAVRLRLAPATRLVRSRWPIHDIRRFALEPGAPKPAAGAQDVAVLRPAFDPEPVLLPPGGAAFLRALLAGERLDAAHDAGLAEASGFDMGALLGRLLAAGAVTCIETPGAEP